MIWRHGHSDLERDGFRTFYVIRPDARRGKSAFGTCDMPNQLIGNRSAACLAYLGARSALLLLFEQALPENGREATGQETTGKRPGEKLPD